MHNSAKAAPAVRNQHSQTPRAHRFTVPDTPVGLGKAQSRSSDDEFSLPRPIPRALRIALSRARSSKSGPEESSSNLQRPKAEGRVSLQGEQGGGQGSAGSGRQGGQWAAEKCQQRQLGVVVVVVCAFTWSARRLAA